VKPRVVYRSVFGVVPVDVSGSWGIVLRVALSASVPLVRVFVDRCSSCS
jgi:hypothetical protein